MKSGTIGWFIKNVRASKQTANKRSTKDHLANSLNPGLYKQKYSLMVMFLRIFAKSIDNPITNGVATHVNIDRKNPFDSKELANFIMSSWGSSMLATAIKPTHTITAERKYTTAIMQEKPTVGQKPHGVGF
jgi:hypothetical protein